MSYYLQIGASGGPTQIASNVGYADFAAWVETLDVQQFEEVVHLYEHGWCQNLASLESQLKDARLSAPKQDDLLDTIDGLIEGIESRPADATVATVTDGIGDEIATD